GGPTVRLESGHPRWHEWETELKRRAEADVVAATAKEKAKTAFIAEWIAGHADPETRQQFDDGLLCRKAAIALIADAALADLPAAAPGYKICDSTSCKCGSKDLDCLPRSVYPVWKALKAKLPEGYTVEFSRVRECLKDEDDYLPPGEDTAAAPVYLAKVTIPYGPFHFEREVKL
ncbi:MAG TPA: hypothetical protein VFO27_19755, partial [Bryobacteraceae bacterium]|nr:hypothetical protein [Bryobacteraceae bacterium]